MNNSFGSFDLNKTKVSKANKKSKNVYFILTENGKEIKINIKYGNCIIPEGVTLIRNETFNNCKLLTNISLPSTLINIGSFAFLSLSREKVPMKQVEVPKNCKIGYHAFEDNCKVIRKWITNTKK